MRRTVVEEHLEEIEVHPAEVYQQLKEEIDLVASEIVRNKSDFIEVNCPGCASDKKERAFVKNDYQFSVCLNCRTLYVTPRPSATELHAYLHESTVAEYRVRTQFLEALSHSFQKTAIYRAERISILHSKFGLERGVGAFVDFRTRNPQYLSKLVDLDLGQVVALEPLCLSGVKGTKVQVTQAFGELTIYAPKFFSAFGVLEHEINPAKILRLAYECLVEGGILILNTRSGSGFDVQVLWENCETVFPLEHINLLTVEGMEALLSRVGFEIVEISTPGQLDVQVIERTLIQKPEMEVSRFINYFFQNRDEFAKQRLQQFLQENLLSSHMRVIARKVTV